jgi:hypothetical protein
VVAMSCHSDSHADRPRRMKRSVRLIVFVLANTGSMICFRRRWARTAAGSWSRACIRFAVSLCGFAVWRLEALAWLNGGTSTATPSPWTRLTARSLQ